MTCATPLFAASLIPSSVTAALPEGYHMRPLQRTDYHGIRSVLSVLTTVGDYNEDEWHERFDWMHKRNQEYFVVVITDKNDKLVATGSLIVERKFIRSLGSVGHIEDIAVAADQQGKKLGLRIIQALDALGANAGCYKSILDCSEKNRVFYEKCGYKLAGIQMAHYYDGGKAKDAPKEAL
ncbi:acyl-CoA N-acyltransferase [Ascodesmis nigricans]|uniref:Glucosamine 6-phosphate N-acetyltransferase n=1 Tax=Ascodesmis nigricans TaxID=341454 RepID=A0A4V3SJM5_9PEZI|nr:acyl-CoA N-acyltransferase [Ascodesmis nigricans]